MKKLIVAGVMALSFFSAGAQNKIGYINLDELISVMPETEKANKEMQEYRQLLAQQYQDLYIDLATKDSTYKADSAKWTVTKREIIKDEITKKLQELQQLDQGIEQKLQQKGEEKIAPIRAKLLETVKVVAKENGYSYVLDQQAVIVGPPGENIAELVKKKLAIKEPAATPPATKPAAKTGGN